MTGPTLRMAGGHGAYEPPSPTPVPTPLPDLAGLERRVELAKDEVVRLCQPSQHWRMRVPVDEARDSDTLLMGALTDASALIAAVRERDAVIAAARELAEHWGTVTDDWGPTRIRKVDVARSLHRALAGLAALPGIEREEGKA